MEPIARLVMIKVAICIKELPVPTAEILEAFPNFPTISKSTAPYAACRINAPSTGIANRSKDWNTGPSVKLISFFDIFPPENVA